MLAKRFGPPNASNSAHRIPDPCPKTTIRAAPFRILLWYFESPRRPQLNMLEWFWLMPAPLTLNTYSYRGKQPGIISSKRNTKHPPNLLVHAPTTKTRHQPSRRTARATEVHEHAAASSWGDGMTRSASPAPESRPRWTTSDSAALLQQKCKRVGGYDFRRTGRSGGGQGVRMVREQAQVRGASRTARATRR